MRTVSKRVGSTDCLHVVVGQRDWLEYTKDSNGTKTASEKGGKLEASGTVNLVVRESMESQLDIGCKAWKAWNKNA